MRVGGCGQPASDHTAHLVGYYECQWVCRLKVNQSWASTAQLTHLSSQGEETDSVSASHGGWMAT